MIVLLILVFDWMLVICKKELSVKNETTQKIRKFFIGKYLSYVWLEKN